MPNETDYLKNIAEEIAAGDKTRLQTDAPDKHLAIEADRLEKVITANLHAITNYTQRETYYFDTLLKLVLICDTLYEVTQTINPNVHMLLRLLNSVRKIIPAELSPKLQLPKAFLQLQKQPLCDTWEEHEAILKEKQVDPKLVAIAEIPFRHFCASHHKLHWRDFTWLKGYQENLENMDWDNADCGSPSEALMSMLIGIDFNDDRFFIYCKKYIRDRISHHHVKKRRLAELMECEKLVLQDTQNELPSYNFRRHDISFKLVSWIKKEADAIKASEGFDDELYKIEFNWDVDTISLFWKYLMEHGITKMTNIDTYAKQIAATCSSKGKIDFKWETVKSRFYSKSQKHLKKVYDPLTSIIEAIRRFLR
jgi:hypothetical protein